MFNRRDFSGLLALAVAAAATPARTQERSPVSRKGEVVALRAFAEQTHPEGPRAALDPTWRSLAGSLADRADQLGDAEYVVAVLRLLAWFKDGHTGVHIAAFNKGAWGMRPPFGRDVFHDGLYITSAKDEAAPLLGARVSHLAGHDVGEVMRAFAGAFPASNIAGAHRWAILLLSSMGWLHGLGVLAGPADSPFEVKGVLPDGRHVSVTVKPRLDGAKGRIPLPRRLSELERFSATQNYGAQPDRTETGRNFVWDRDLGKTLYVSYDRMSDDDFSKPFEVFKTEVIAALDRSKADRLIIDLRRNGGGDNMLSEPVRHHIARSRFNAPGRLYVMIQPHTFSAAMNLATRLERETFATFVGEPTSLAPNHYGDATPFKADVSGLPIEVSTLRWMDSSPADKRPWLMPDLLVPETYGDYLAGRDRAFEAALSHVDQRPIDDNLLTTPWERPSQAQTWKPFWVT